MLFGLLRACTDKRRISLVKNWEIIILPSKDEPFY